MAKNVWSIASKARWLGLSILWGALLLSGLLLLASGPLVSHAAASTTAVAGATEVVKAEPESIEKKPIASPSKSLSDTSTIAFSSATYTVQEDAGSQLIVLDITPPISSPVTVTVSSANIQAVAAEDFEGVRQSLVVSPSESVYILPVTIFDDLLVEGDEQLRLTLGNYEGAAPGVITETVLTIIDNDVAYLSISDVVVSEEAGSVVILITQSVTSTLESLVKLRTLDGSAQAPDDYVEHFASTPIVIPVGNTQVSVTVQLNGDDEVEGTETFIIQLEDPTNAELATMSDTMTATVTLLDDDVYPEISVQPAETNESDGLLSFAVSLNNTWGQTVTVEYATRDGSAVAPGDYLSKTGVLQVSPGVLTATIEIIVLNDDVDESDETFFVDLTNPIQAILSNNEVEGIIRDTFQHLNFLPALTR